MVFDVAYIDPPWQFDTIKTGGNFKSGAKQKYDVMDLPSICRLPIPSILAPSSAVFIWVPTRLKFSHGLAVMNAWGLDYITTVYWDKQRMGMGYWFRNSVEELLVCQRRGGSLQPFLCQMPNMLHVPMEPADLVHFIDQQPNDLIHHPPLEHSEKPEAFRQLIEIATGKISRRHNVELFARKTVPGWTCLGNQVTGRTLQQDIRLILAA